MGMLFMPAAICLSAPLLFKSIPSKYHSTVSACVLLTVAFGGILACSMKNTVMHMRTSMWAYALIFTATCSLCCFLVAKFYYFKAGLQAPEKNIHEGKIQFSPYILLFLSGALLGITIGFPMLLSNPYFTESLILNFAGGLFPSFLHWILLSLFLLPANYAFKKFGLVKTMYASILGTFFSAVILEHNAEMAIPTYVVFRLFIAFSSALCLVSLFLIIYKTTQKTNSIYSPVLWTSWGYIATIALRAFIGQSCQLPVILVSVLMLLIGLLLYQFMLIKYYKKDLASFSH
jgi:hypothetical protein